METKGYSLEYIKLEYIKNGDTSAEALEFYMDLWKPFFDKSYGKHERVKDVINCYDECGSYIVKFTGECLNTFNTVLGDKRNVDWGDYETDRTDFKKKNQVLANFMPLPSVTFCSMIPSLNQLKGNYSKYGFRDFMDMFLVVVKAYYDGKEDKDCCCWTDKIPEEMFIEPKSFQCTEWKKGIRIVFTANEKCYFDKFIDFKDYCKINFLKCYLKEGTEDINFFTGEVDKNHRIGSHCPKEGQPYVEWAMAYVAWANERIDKRAEEIFKSEQNQKVNQRKNWMNYEHPK